MNKEYLKQKLNLFLGNDFSKLNFITFEGIDGCGKTTIINKVYEKLNKINNLSKKIVLTREPGGTEIGEKIRTIVLENKMNPITEALLYASARSEHVANIIYPSIVENKLILCDRYIESSICYQGVGKGLGINNIIEINKFATNNLNPDLIFYIDVSVETSIERMKSNRIKMDRFDLMKLEEKNQIKKAYDNIFESKRNVIKIDGSLDIETISNQILDIILFLLESEKMNE